MHACHAAKTLTPDSKPPFTPSVPLPTPHLHTHLHPQQPPQRTPIPQINPLALHPIISLRPAHRAREPDLFVGGLFVEDVGAVGGEGEG